MIPASLLGLILFVLAVAPGWLWVRVAEKREVRPERSGLLEAAELVVMGVIFTTVAAFLVWLVANQSGWLPDLRSAFVGDPYWQREPYRAALTGGSIFVLSMAGAYVTARVVYWGKEPSLSPAGSVWRDVFAEGGEGRPIFVSAELVDGRVVEGYLYSYSIDPGGEERDIALQAPFLRSEDGSRQRAPADRAILRRKQIAAVWVRYD